jgi:thiamine phosphate synthase YjbQ (UPF0047 family)
MQRVTVQTLKKREVLDITDLIEGHLQSSVASTGVCTCLCCTPPQPSRPLTSIPGTDLDMLDAFEAMVPKLRYRHPHNPPHLGDHMMAALIGTSVSLPFERNCCWARGSV